MGFITIFAYSMYVVTLQDSVFLGMGVFVNTVDLCVLARFNDLNKGKFCAALMSCPLWDFARVRQNSFKYFIIQEAIIFFYHILNACLQ